MSEQKNKKQNTASLIATIVVTVLAIAAVVAMIFVMNGGNGGNSSAPQSEIFRPTAEFEQECEYQAHDLVKGSYDVIRLFVTQGLPHKDEPYGNAPEDGIYTVDTELSGDYKTLSDIEKKVLSVYTSEAADTILNDIDGKGLSVYKNRKVLVDNDSSAENAPRYKEETVLGISADFKADAAREKLWESCSLAVFPKSETICEITIYLGGAGETSDLSSVDADNILRTEMIKTDAGWRLTKFVY